MEKALDYANPTILENEIYSHILYLLLSNMFIISTRKKVLFMVQNKKSVWSVIILVATIISLILLIAQVVTTAVAIPTAVQLVRTEGGKQGLPADQIELLVAAAIGSIVAGLVAGSIIEILRIIGGFLFSLKGRWGVFCIVMAIISGAFSVYTLISAITTKSGAGTIVIAAIDLVICVLLIVACFKHYAENKK